MIGTVDRFSFDGDNSDEDSLLTDKAFLNLITTKFQLLSGAALSVIEVCAICFTSFADSADFGDTSLAESRW